MRNISIDNILENADNLLAELSIYSLRGVKFYYETPQNAETRDTNLG